MARNDRAGNWSQPRRSNPAKSRPSCSRGLETADFDDLGEIMNVLTGGEKNRNRKDTWNLNRGVPKNGTYSSSDCCLKNGRVQCSCLWPKNSYMDCPSKGSYNLPPKPPPVRGSALPYDNKSTWPNSNTNGYFGSDKMPEEFILDDNELCLLNYYDIPINVPKRHHVRNVGKVKTVSIIDTLSELASGATDREDEGGFSSTVSESAILNSDIYRTRARHARQSANRRGRGTRSSYITSTPFSKFTPELSSPVNKSAFSPPVKPPLGSVSSSLYSENFGGDDGNFSCSSLKRTLKYLRKAVSTNVVEEENKTRRHIRGTHDRQAASRLCFSDSEVWDTPEHWPTLKKDKPDTSSRTKSRSLLAVAVPPMLDHSVRNVPLFRGRVKSAVPDWIQNVFTAAKRGDVEKMKQSLKDIDSSLIRNLSDDHGNNLWHICAVYNNFECLNWLCSHNLYQGEALKDENKNGFTPVALAVKHGSLLSVQWLIHNTDSKSQLLSKSGSRSLLHVAARYGQDSVVEWLIGYMITQDLEIGISDSEGNTPLHLAAKYGHIASVKALIFHSGSLKTRNEHGMKPLDLAVKHSKPVCADYLVAIETCHNLAAINLRHNWNIQQLQKENAEIKSHFKELLTLTKRLQHRQRELVQSLTRMNFSEKHVPATNERSSEKLTKYLDDYSQLLATVMTDEEHRLLMVEDKWKKSRKQMKFTDSKKRPLDILKSQFSHILEKVVNQTPPIPTPETSDDSWHSGDEDRFQSECSHTSFSAPDVVNSLSPQTSVPYLDTGRNIQKEKESSLKVPKCSDRNSGFKLPLSSSSKSEHHVPSPVAKNTAGSARDVNLQTFFKQNPNLRQTSETCSVLEVLEPSSSDSEDCINKKKRLAKSLNAEKELEQSSSSSVVETLSPYSCHISSSDSKASGSRSSSSGSRQNPFPKPSGNSQTDSNECGNMDKNKGSENKGNDSSEGSREKGSTDNLCNNNLPESFSVEPDLIKGTQKKKMPSPNMFLDKEKRPLKESIATIDAALTDNISTEDSESLEADRSFSSAVDVSDALLTSPASIEPTSSGTAIKKKSFLLKFALRGRWPSKSSPRSPKNEISPEEFRETYSRSASVDNISPSTSQAPDIADVVEKKPSTLPKYDTLNIRGGSPNKDLTSSSEQLDDSSSFSPPSVTDSARKGSLFCGQRLLPPRRDPPPAPPFNVKDDDPDHSDDDVSLSVEKSTFSLSSCVGDCITPPASSHNSYITSRSSDLWPSPDSKSLFRPASSASRFESPSRAEESFPLNKSSSASTEMLSALDSSTAGRQSPAPSEVSKTESALSPPSDVSKTESTRHLSQLGRIEESAHLKASSIHQKTADEPLMTDIPLTQEIKPEVKKKKSKKSDSDKPWYEFSDEEDVIVPQRYQAVSVSMRSSSEDEAVTS